MITHHISTSKDITLQVHQCISVLRRFPPCWASHQVPYDNDQLKASTHLLTYTKKKAALASNLPPKSLSVLTRQDKGRNKLMHEKCLGSESSSTTKLSLNLEMLMSSTKSI